MREFKESVLTLFFWLGITGVEPLKDVKAIVPSAVNLGNHVTLTCLFDLDYNESLYTVKWYLNSEEFYRYVPKESPPIQIFPIFDMDVNVVKSDDHKVLLRSVRHEHSGIYKCEVSEDAPYFDTKVVSAQMTIVEFPENNPLIQIVKNRYEVGEKIWANCSFGPSRPAANISWYINNVQVKNYFVTEFPLFEDGKNGYWVMSSVGMDTDVTSFRVGLLKLKCIANVFSVYSRMSEVQIVEEKPRSASVLGPKDSSGKPISFNTSGQPSSGVGGNVVAYSSSASSKFYTTTSKHSMMISVQNIQLILTTVWILTIMYYITASNCAALVSPVSLTSKQMVVEWSRQ